VEGASAETQPLGQEHGFATRGAHLPTRQSSRQSILRETTKVEELAIRLQ